MALDPRTVNTADVMLLYVMFFTLNPVLLDFIWILLKKIKKLPKSSEFSSIYAHSSSDIHY